METPKETDSYKETEYLTDEEIRTNQSIAN
jgi:hypothetical protein